MQQDIFQATQIHVSLHRVPPPPPQTHKAISRGQTLSIPLTDDDCYYQETLYEQVQPFCTHS